MMKPDFVKLHTWRSLPEERLNDVLYSAGKLLREGEEPEPAFWEMAFQHCEEDILSFYGFSDKAALPSWGSMKSADQSDRKRVFRILVDLKSTAAEMAAKAVNTDLEPIDFPSHLPKLPGSDKTCLYCGKSLKFGKLSKTEKRLHFDCFQGWRSFAFTVSDTLQAYAESLHEDHRPPREEVEIDDDALSDMDLEETDYLSIFHQRAED